MTFHGLQAFLSHAHHFPCLDHLIPGAVHEARQVVHLLQVQTVRVNMRPLHHRTQCVPGWFPFHADCCLALLLHAFHHQVFIPIHGHLWQGNQQGAIVYDGVAPHQSMALHQLGIRCCHHGLHLHHELQFCCLVVFPRGWNFLCGISIKTSPQIRMRKVHLLSMMTTWHVFLLCMHWPQGCPSIL